MLFEVKLLDKTRSVLATASVEGTGDAFSGKVSLRTMPPRVRQLFAQYEEIVNNQVLSLVDEIEDEIAAIHIVAQFSDGSEAQLKDVQIFPEAGTISFKAVREAMPLR